MDQNHEVERHGSGAGAGTVGATATVSLVYFASVRESIGVSGETVDLPSTVSTVGGLIAWLRERGEGYEAALNDALGIRSAVDRVHATPETSIRGAREIAIFPMMTGG